MNAAEMEVKEEEEEVRRWETGQTRMKSLADGFEEYSIGFVVGSLPSGRRLAPCPAETTAVRVADGGGAIGEPIVGASPKPRLE